MIVIVTASLDVKISDVGMVSLGLVELTTELVAISDIPVTGMVFEKVSIV